MKIKSGRVKTQILYIFFKIYDKRRSLMNFTKEDNVDESVSTENLEDDIVAF